MSKEVLFTRVTVVEQMNKAKKILVEVVIPRNKLWSKDNIEDKPMYSEQEVRESMKQIRK